MQFRHEWKHEINAEDIHVLCARLDGVLQRDEHALDGQYSIRSLYFDDPTDRAYREKINGVNEREKFRMRYYNKDPQFILLEKKIKHAGLCGKEQQRLTIEETQAILDQSAPLSEVPLVREFQLKQRNELLRPSTIVDYTRIPFVYGPGNVRVTIDMDIRTGLRCVDFLDPQCVTIPVPDPVTILEVKWDDYLPSLIKDLVQLKGRHTSSYSKYASCRSYD